MSVALEIDHTPEDLLAMEDGKIYERGMPTGERELGSTGGSGFKPENLCRGTEASMCGIVGYTGAHAGCLDPGRRACAGSSIAATTAPGWRRSMRDRLVVRKRAGRVRALEELLEREPAPGACGISHTRWATHGPATDRNAHPHLGRPRPGRPRSPSCTTA